METSEPTVGRGPKVAGILLIVASCIAIFFILHHPTGSSHSFGEFVDEVRSEPVINLIVHGTMISVMLLFVYCVSWLSSCLGFGSSWVRVGMVSYSLGAIAMVAAATVSGLIVPGFMSRYTGATADQFEIGRQILGMLREVNRSCDLLGVVAMSAGVCSWSVAMLVRRKKNWITGILGLVVGVIGVAGVFF